MSFRVIDKTGYILADIQSKAIPRRGEFIRIKEDDGEEMTYLVEEVVHRYAEVAFNNYNTRVEVYVEIYGS